MEELAKKINKLRTRLLEGVKDVVIIPHISPDGDAAGSCSALAEIMSILGIRWNIVMCDHFPEYLLFLKNLSQAISYQDKPEECEQLIQNADMVFMLDHNSVKREGLLEPIVAATNADHIIIDHHLEPDDLEIVISDTRVSSTCELLYIVSTRVWGKEILTPTIADSLYTGINTDTGGLSHNSSLPGTYLVIANLLKVGLNKAYVHEHLYQMNQLSRLRLTGHVLLNKLEIDEHYPVAVLPITREELLKYDYKDGDLEGVVNIPLSIHNVDVSVQITQRRDRVKLSFRSKRDIPVNQWAKKWFNGGGHLNAAGGYMDEPFEQVVEKFYKTIPLFYEEFVNHK